MRRLAIFVTLLLPLLRCSTASQTDTPPVIEREMRGVWIATVNNIDWPSRRDLTVEQQQTELVALFDRVKTLGFNTIVFQVRPAADALYASDLEPWSEYLTGEMGRAPEPFWDPLAFAVRQAHERGLELHAWFNPYRARHPSSTSAIPESHISRTRPDLVRTYGKHLWLDPGEPEVRALTKNVILDVVRRYDVDGIHLDDYFYPYPENDSSGEEISFPDAVSFSRYQTTGGTLDRNDWRRENVNLLVRELYTEVKGTKPHVKVGISPFGIWRPGHPESVRGFDAYEKLYADSRLWLREGWLDYFAPQLYWSIDSREQSFPELLSWWMKQNPLGRTIVPGISISRVANGRPNALTSSEIVNQIRIVRTEGAGGVIHFSMKALIQNRDELAERVGATYSTPALLPAMSWVDVTAPARPSAKFASNVQFAPGDDEAPALWVIQQRDRRGWRTEIHPAHVRGIEVGPEVRRVHIRAVDRAGNLSPSAIVLR